MASPAVPLRQRGERLFLVIAVMVDRSVGECLQPLDQGRPHRGLAYRVVRPVGLVLDLPIFADQESCEVVGVPVRDAFEIHDQLNSPPWQLGQVLDVDLPCSNRQGLQLQAVPYLPPGLLPATPGAIDVRQLTDREDTLVVVLPHQLGRHPVQQAQVVLLFRLLETGVPEGAARTVFVQDNRWSVADWVISPGPQGVDDSSHLFVFAGHLYLAGVATQPDQRS